MTILHRLHSTPIVLAVLVVTQANATEISDATVIEVNAARPTNAAAKNSSSVAPSQGDFSASEPRSRVSAEFAANQLAPTSDYGSIVQITPGVLSIAPNGAGLSESKLSFRGFQDGAFNLTFDGIPFGDSNDATHHSNSYFPTQFLGETVIIRGPGGASNLGFATFGGSIGLSSKPLTEKAYTAPYASLGSRHTRLLGLEAGSGKPSAADGINVQVNVQHLDSDGFQSQATTRRDSILLKAQQQVNASLQQTGFATFNRLHSAIPTGITLAQAAQYGDDYGLGTDRSKGSYFGFNTRDRSADFSYFGVLLTLANGWEIDNKLYTSGYQYGPDLFADTTDTKPLGNKFSAPGNQDVVGGMRHNHWRTVGDLFMAKQKAGDTTLTTGLWLDQSRTTRFRQTVDFSLGQFPVAPVDDLVKSINYSSSAVVTTVQPFVEFEMPLSSSLKLNAGLKYAYFKQVVDEEPDRQNFSIPVTTGGTYKRVLPSTALRFAASSETSLYLQYAEGIQMPPTGLYDIPRNGAIRALPDAQRTRSYQIGGVLQKPRLTLSWDAYLIKFDNAIIANVDNSGETLYSNNGGARYRGAEVEATLALGHGVSLYANAAVAHARSIGTDAVLPYAPNNSQVVGVSYADATDKANIFARRTGAFYGGAGSTSGEQFRIPAGTIVDLKVSHALQVSSHNLKSLRIDAGINNLFDHRGVTDAFTGMVPTYNYQSRRNVYVAANLYF